MRILLLGAGLQGKAALHDLVNSKAVTKVIAADADTKQLDAAAQELPLGKITATTLDACDHDQVALLMHEVQAVVVMLPPAFGFPIAQLAINCGIHYIDAYYTSPEHQDLDAKASDRGLSILTEFGLDPGIDLLLAGQAVSELDQVKQLDIYGAGIPDQESANNPLKYKISWSFASVLQGYRDRPARIVCNGKPVDVPPEEIFSKTSIRTLNLENIGLLEAYPSEDVTTTLDVLGVTENVHTAGRYSMRWPGHCAFWDKMVNLGFLDHHSTGTGDLSISPRQFVHDLLSPQLQYEDEESDLAIVRVDARGIKNGRSTRILYELIDRRDLETGLLAMQRTVGFTASIGVQMILRGDINKRGVLSPAKDVPRDIFFSELRKRGIVAMRRQVPTEQQ